MADARERYCHVAAQLQHLQMCKVTCVLQLFSLGGSMVKDLSAAPMPMQLGCSSAESGETNVRWSDKGAWQKRRLWRMHCLKSSRTHLSGEVSHVGAHDHKRDLIDRPAEGQILLARRMFCRGRPLKALQQERARQCHQNACVATSGSSALSSLHSALT